MREKYSMYIELCKKQLFFIIFGFSLLILEAIVIIRMPFVMNDLIDRILQLTKNNYNMFLRCFLLYVVLFLFQIILSFISSVLFKYVGNNNAEKIGNIILKKIFYSIKSEPAQFTAGDAMVVLSNDIFDLGEKGIILIYKILYLMINILAVFYYMCKTNFYLALLVTVIFVILMLIQKSLNNKICNLIESIRDDRGSYSQISSSIVIYYTDYRRNKCFKYIETNFNEKFKNLLTKNLNLEKLISLNQLISGIGVLTNIVVIFFIGAISIIYGKMSISNLITFNMFANVFGGNIISIPELLVEIKNFETSNSRVDKMNKLNCYFDRDNKEIKGIKYINKIELQNVYFSYKNGTNIISDLNVIFEKGNIYCIKGQNGAGKSTLLSLLSGEYPINGGVIKLNEINFNLYENKLGLDNHLTFFPSNAIIYSDTILRNFVLEQKNYEMETIVSICKTVGIMDWIDSQNNRFETKLEDINKNLSDGQKQKIALVRCFLDNKEVIIFDELEKHIDMKSKVNIMDYLVQKKYDKIIIITTHDDFIQSRCNKTIYI